MLKNDLGELNTPLLAQQDCEHPAIYKERGTCWQCDLDKRNRNSLAQQNQDEQRVTPETSDGWRDIESAPKDGTVIRVFSEKFIHPDFNPTGILEAYWQDGEGFMGAVWNGCFDGWEAKKVKPTHWLDHPPPPLPAPPVTGDKDEEKANAS